MLFPTKYNFNKNLFDDFFTDSFFSPSVVNRMSTDIKEMDNEYELTMEVPGFAKEDLKLELENGYLTVSAEHKSSNETSGEDGQIIKQERYYGSCKRSFYVGEYVKKEDVSAKYEKGILTVLVPKKEVKQIETDQVIEIQ